MRPTSTSAEQAATDLTVVDDTTITADSPAGTGLVNVTVTNPDGTSPFSAADQFTYTAAVAKHREPGPDQRACCRRHIDYNHRDQLYRHNCGVDSALHGDGCTVVDDTTITADSPAGTGEVAVTVVTPAGTSAATPADQFTYLIAQAPTITSANATTFAVGIASDFTVTTTGSPTAALTETGTLPWA